jgi:hypothetical protein
VQIRSGLEGHALLVLRCWPIGLNMLCISLSCREVTRC